MMIRYRCLNIAWLRFRKGKRSSDATDDFSYKLEDNLWHLTKQINDRNYVHGGYKRIIVQEKKRRDLAVATVPDRVVHRLVYDRLVNIYDKTFDPDVWSCRAGKGLHRALDRTQTLLKKYRNSFVWRADITKFFDNVDHQTLYKMLERKLLHNNDILWLCRQIINSYTVDRQTPFGIPIGNLTSQIFSNIYLHEFDRFVRHTLKPHAYVRYGDDFILFAQTRRSARFYEKQGTKFLTTNLKLTINYHNNVIVPTAAGLHFLGHVITSTYAVVDRHTTKSILRKLNVTNIASYKSLALVKQGRRSIDWRLIEEIDKILD